MSGLRYAEVSQKEQKFLDMTSLTVEEFDQLVPAFEEAFEQRLKEWCLDGKPRTGREYRTYANCPLPTPEDRLLFILVYILSRDCGGIGKKVVSAHAIVALPHSKCARLLTTYRKRPKGLSQNGGTQEAGFYDGDERHQENWFPKPKELASLMRASSSTA